MREDVTLRQGPKVEGVSHPVDQIEEGIQGEGNSMCKDRKAGKSRTSSENSEPLRITEVSRRWKAVESSETGEVGQSRNAGGAIKSWPTSPRPF